MLTHSLARKERRDEWKGIRICHVITRSLLIVHDDGHYLSHKELIYLKQILSLLIIYSFLMVFQICKNLNLTFDILNTKFLLIVSSTLPSLLNEKKNLIILSVCQTRRCRISQCIFIMRLDVVLQEISSLYSNLRFLRRRT